MSGSGCVLRRTDTLKIRRQGAASRQSDEGKGRGSWTFISFSQQTKVPSPALVQSTSVPQTSHLYRFPSLLMAILLHQSLPINYWDLRRPLHE